MPARGGPHTETDSIGRDTRVLARLLDMVKLIHTSHKHTDKNITNNKQYKVQFTKDKHMTAEV